MALWDWSSDHIYRPNREDEVADWRLFLRSQELGTEIEGRWRVEIRNWKKPTQWDTKIVSIERFPSGNLEVVDEERQQVRHVRDVRRWIEKLPATHPGEAQREGRE